MKRGLNDTVVAWKILILAGALISFTVVSTNGLKGVNRQVLMNNNNMEGCNFPSQATKAMDISTSSTTPAASTNATTTDVADDATTKTDVPRKPRLADGCYHVFLDVGANIGVHGRFLYEPQKYPDSKNSVKLFETMYGKDRANEDYCVFEVEANSQHWPRLDEVSSVYEQMGWRYQIIKAAASDRVGTMVFYHQGDGKQNEWAFSVKDWKKGDKAGGGREEVPTIRLAEWLQHEIYERQIPETPPSGRTYEEPIVGMKLDIEASEYVVLPDMMMTGTYCKLGFIFGETHPKHAPLNFEGHKIKLQERTLRHRNTSCYPT